MEMIVTGGTGCDWLYVLDHCIAIDRIIRDGKVGDAREEIRSSHRPFYCAKRMLLCSLQYVGLQ